MTDNEKSPREQSMDLIRQEIREILASPDEDYYDLHEEVGYIIMEVIKEFEKG